jgi:hypothetical protein
MVDSNWTILANDSLSTSQSLLSLLSTTTQPDTTTPGFFNIDYF